MKLEKFLTLPVSDIRHFFERVTVQPETLPEALETIVLLKAALARYANPENYYYMFHQEMGQGFRIVPPIDMEEHEGRQYAGRLARAALGNCIEDYFEGENNAN